MQLEGARALITGSSSGLGLALAREASRRGMTLVLTGRNEAALNEARASLTTIRKATTCAADITGATGRSAIVETVHGAMGGLDILVNNAGVQTVGRLAEHGDAAITAMLTTNLAAPMALCRDFLPDLKASASSRIVNIGSMFGEIAFPLFSGYSASKFALRGLSDALRRELADDGIGVTHISPRAIRTPAFEHSAWLAEAFSMHVDEPEVIARRIWNAVAKDQDNLYPGIAEWFFLLVQRLQPQLIDRDLVKRLRKTTRAP